MIKLNLSLICGKTAIAKILAAWYQTYIKKSLYQWEVVVVNIPVE
jgi:hypothetical protein